MSSTTIDLERVDHGDRLDREVDKLFMPTGRWTGEQYLLGELSEFGMALDPALIALQIDVGTGIHNIVRLDEPPSTASPLGFSVDSGLRPWAPPRTRMGRIREKAKLTLRKWATVFGVSHTTIQDWERAEPAREELDQVLELLERAQARQPDLSTWLMAPVSSDGITPLDLLAKRRWRAFRGATRLSPAPSPGIEADELRRRRREAGDWAVTDRPDASQSE